MPGVDMLQDGVGPGGAMPGVGGDSPSGTPSGEQVKPSGEI